MPGDTRTGRRLACLFRALFALAVRINRRHRQRILSDDAEHVAINGNRTHVHNPSNAVCYGVLENEPRSLDCRRLINSAVGAMDNDFDAGHREEFADHAERRAFLPQFRDAVAVRQ